MSIKKEVNQNNQHRNIHLQLNKIDKNNSVNKYYIHINYSESLGAREQGLMNLEFGGDIAATSSVITLKYEEIISKLMVSVGKPLPDREYVKVSSINGEYIVNLISGVEIHFKEDELLSLTDILDEFCKLLNQE